MNSATLVSSMATCSIPQNIIVTYGYLMGSDSTSFFSIDIPGLIIDDISYRQGTKTMLTGKAYVIDLSIFSISCDSPNFDVNVVSRGDISNIGTVYEVLTYTGLNKSLMDLFDKFVIRNEDIVTINKLYLKITNHSGSAGNVLIQLTYTVLQDRLPT